MKRANPTVALFVAAWCVLATPQDPADPLWGKTLHSASNAFVKCWRARAFHPLLAEVPGTTTPCGIAYV